MHTSNNEKEMSDKINAVYIFSACNNVSSFANKIIMLAFFSRDRTIFVLKR